MEAGKFSPEKLAQEHIDFWKNFFRSAMNNIAFVQEQFEKITGTMIKEYATLQEENMKMLKDWLANCKKGREEFQKVIEANLSKMEEMFSPKNAK